MQGFDEIYEGYNLNPDGEYAAWHNYHKVRDGDH